ncbi:MAG: YraN family protein [Parvularculaceae bacterium]
MTADARQRAEREGRRAEFIAGLYLRLLGFSIVTERARTPSGEIDLVARRGPLLVFAEVKRRASLDEAVLAVTPAARARIENAVKSWLSRHPHLAGSMIRYDIIALAGWRLRHLRDAWRDRR